MLQRFTELEEAVKNTIALLDTTPHIIVENCYNLRDLQTLSEPFEEVTWAVSGQQYMTASLVIVITNSLLDICKEVSTRLAVIAKVFAKRL